MKKARYGKAFILSALIATAICCVALAFSWLYFNFKKPTAADLAEDNAAVILERKELKIDLASLSTVQSNWSAAVQESVTNGTQVTVKLTENWMNKTLGTGVGFSEGRIHVPKGANIKLDLNGKKISRNLTSKTANGNLILVEGTLEICDTSSLQRGTLTGAHAAANGAVIVDGGSLTLTAGSIKDNKGIKGAGVLLDNGATFTMNGGAITGNSNDLSTGSGAGVCIGKNCSFILNDGKISENDASKQGGGGVWLAVDSNAYFEMNGGEISDNKCSSGGGVYISDGLFKMTGGVISGNSGPANAGGVAVNKESAGSNGAFIMTGGTITGNSAAMGGGVYVYPGCTFEMSGGEISNNIGTSYGGGVQIEDSEFNMSDGVISGNKCTAGGSVYIGGAERRQGGTFHMTGGEITGNGRYSGSDHGIGVSSVNGIFIMDGGKITDNHNAAARGGGVMVYDRFVMNGGEISGNSALDGGGVCVGQCGLMDFNGGKITNNTATTGNAGGIMTFAYGDEAPVINMTGGEISYNKAMGTSSGGGVFIGTSCTLNATGVKFIGNSAVKNMGGAISTYGKTTIKNCEFTENSANHAGAIYVDNYTGVTDASKTANVTVIDSIIKNNTATAGDGGAFIVDPYTTLTLTDCEVSGNTAKSNGGSVCVKSNGRFELNGGTITNNRSGASGGGIYLSSGITFRLSGGFVYGNTGSGTAKNVYFSGNSDVITITGKLSRETTYIGLTRYVGTDFTSGYTAKGNKISDGELFFFHDNILPIRGNSSGTEILISSNVSSQPTKTNITWKFKASSQSSYTSIPVSALNKQVEYIEGEYYTLSTTAGFTVKDEDGNRVISMSKVGKYYATADSVSSYYNPILIFEIVPKELDANSITVTADSAVYSGEALTPTVKVTLGGRTLKKGVDYTVSYKNNVNAGNEAVAVITGAGNYTGSVECNFTIEKANLGVRLGQTTVEYNGKPQNVQVYLEGLKGKDVVEAKVTYTLNGVAVDSPENAGTYVATVTIDDKNYKFTSVQEYSFTVNPKKINVIWENTTFDYDGQEHVPTAYFVTVDGVKVSLEVTHPNSVAAATYQASVTSLPQGYENYVISLNATKEYSIVKSGLHAVWIDNTYTYDGTAKELKATLTDSDGKDLSSYLSYEYFDKDGNPVTPVDAGEYTVKITLNHTDYTLGGDTEYKYVIGKAEAVITLGGYDGIYSGDGKTPLQSVQTAGGDDLQYKATYAEADVYGNPVGEFKETLPVNVGRYILKVEILDSNYCVTGAEYFTEVYEVEAKEISVVWSGDGTSMFDNGVYKWLYDGNKHAPTATADGIELTVTGENSTVTGVLTATASLNDANYKLTGSLTASYQIIKSVVTGTVWYEYGSDTPIDVDGGEIPEIPYISVYGKDGPKFSAYGVLTAADSSVVWTATDTSYIKLQVSYPEFEQGYWTVREQAYTASATLSGADRFNDSCNMPLSVAASAQFKVTDLSHESQKAVIKWVVVGENGEHLDASSYEFIYNGTPQCPKAIRITDPDNYDAANPVDGTYEFLTVSGESTDAGTYFAFIVPKGNYAIEGDVSDFKYTIKPKQITVNWNVGTYVYDGVTEHKPVATPDDTDGIPCTVTVNGYVEAGDWTATADAGKNFEITQNATCNFTVERMTLKGVEWSFAPGDEGEVRPHEDGDYFVWAYDGNVHTPVASLKVQIDGKDVEISVIVTGGMSEVGTHYAFAALDSADFANANFKLEVEKLRFDIVRDTVNIVWADEDANGDIIFDYDGTTHAPTAYYTAGGKQIPLNVVGSATEAGTYVAYITDKLDIANGATHEFTIRAKELSVNWSDLSKEYDGTVKYPTVTFTDAADPTATVTLVLGEDYTLTGFIDAGNYTSVINFINKNYSFAAGSGEALFEITKKDVVITWYGNNDGTFVWKYDGNKHAPTLTASVTGINVTVVGEESATGVYTATAVIDNDNYNLVNATQVFEIKPFEITVVWAGRNEVQPDGTTVEKFDWEFDGEHTFAPTASYLDGEGNTVLLEVLGGKIYAGKYVASIVLPENCELAAGETGTKEYEITKKIVQGIIWTGNKTVDVDGNEVETFEWEYDGKPHSPTAQIRSTGATLTVTGAAVNAGEYTATAVLADENNYEFAAGVDTTHTYKINPKKNVDVLWYGNGGTLGENFNTYAYDGITVYCPVAKFVDVEGNEVEMPVNGGTASAGQWTATAIGDVFANYEFRTLKLTRTFEIVKGDIAITWQTGYTDVDGTYTYTFTYDGLSKLPEATNTTNAITFAYVIRNAAGVKVDLAVNAGEYTVEAIPNDGNFKIADHAKVKVIIEKRSVAVQWGNTALTANGEAQSPEAWYVDAEGNKVNLAVTGATSEIGTGHQATASLVSDGEKANYTLTGETTTFSVTVPVQVTYVWVWDDETSTGSWVIKTDGSESDGDETTEP